MSIGRKVLIDCGANTCTIIRKYIADYSDFEFFAFEAQPELSEAGSKLLFEYGSECKIHFLNQAVWIDYGRHDLFLATKWGPNYRGGSTLLHGHTKNLSEVDYQNPISVETIDFSNWLADNFRENDLVVVKMDIEGAEYPVLEKVIADGNIRLIDELIIEFHVSMNEEISRERHDALVNTLESSLTLRYL